MIAREGRASPTRSGAGSRCGVIESDIARSHAMERASGVTQEQCAIGIEAGTRPRESGAIHGGTSWQIAGHAGVPRIDHGVEASGHVAIEPVLHVREQRLEELGARDR